MLFCNCRFGQEKFQWISCLKTRRTEAERTLAFKSPNASSSQASVCFMPIQIKLALQPVLQLNLAYVRNSCVYDLEIKVYID